MKAVSEMSITEELNVRNKINVNIQARENNFDTK